MTQERIDLGFPHRARVPHAMKAHESPQPVLIARHRAAGVMPHLQLLSVALDQARRLIRVGHRWGVYALGVFPYFDNHQQQLFITWNGDASLRPA